MVAEILAGLALAKSAVSGIKSMIDTANDVSDIAHHIDDLFKSRDQVKRDIHKNQNKKPQSKMRAMFNRKMHEDEDDDLSVGAVATMVLEQKKMDREILNLGIRIDNKFGEGTWDEILETRKKMIAEHKKTSRGSKRNGQTTRFRGSRFLGKSLDMDMATNICYCICYGNVVVVILRK